MLVQDQIEELGREEAPYIESLFWSSTQQT